MGGDARDERSGDGMTGGGPNIQTCERLLLMPKQTPRSCSSSSFPPFAFFHFQSPTIWGNKNWPPSMKVTKLENLGNIIVANGCKWSILNAPGTENSLSYPFLGLGEFPFLIISPLG